MNESELEEQLRRWKPATPPAGLQEAIVRELMSPLEAAETRVISSANETESVMTRILHGLPWALGGAAAAVMVMTAIEPTGSRVAIGETPQPPAKPVETQMAAAPQEFRAETPSREILQAVEGDVILAEREEPTRLVRVNSLERRTWSNPHTGAQIAVELPREDLLLVPVDYQ